MKRGKYELRTGFYLKRSRKDEKGFCPVYMIIKLNGKQTQVSIGISLKSKDWDGKNTRVVGRSELAVQQNLMLEHLKTKLQFEFVVLEQQGKSITPGVLKAIITGGKVRKNDIESLGLEYIAKVRAEKKRSTISHLETYYKHICRFLKETGNIGIEADELDHRFMVQYADWLKSRKGFNGSHIRAVTTFVKSLTKYAYTYNYIEFDPIGSYVSPRFKSAPILFLEEEEVERLQEYSFASPSLKETADLFLLQCYTGLSYSDLMRFTKDEFIRKGPDGQDWIEYNRLKTESRASLPLLPRAKMIFEKYNYHLPYLLNQIYNRYLKEISHLLNFKVGDKLTTHVGRKTFGMLCLNSGVSLEVVSKCMGHSTTEMTIKHYARLLDKAIARDMQKMLMHVQKRQNIA